MKVVSIGGGTGLSALLRGLKHHVAERSRPAQLKPSISRLTAVVTVTDEGGSSGRLRRDFQIRSDFHSCAGAAQALFKKWREWIIAQHEDFAAVHGDAGVQQ